MRWEAHKHGPWNLILPLHFRLCGRFIFYDLVVFKGAFSSSDSPQKNSPCDLYQKFFLIDVNDLCGLRAGWYNKIRGQSVVKSIARLTLFRYFTIKVTSTSIKFSLSTSFINFFVFSNILTTVSGKITKNSISRRAEEFFILGVL